MQSVQDNWKSHFDLFKDIPNRPAATLQKVLDLTKNTTAPVKSAIDLGCGAGSDTFALLKNGWSVLAVDSSEEAIRSVEEKCPKEVSTKLRVLRSDFETLADLPVSHLVNASFSLPFCHPDSFTTFWEKINESIAGKGYFSGHFFGKNDGWSENPDMTFHDETQVRRLFQGFRLEAFREVNEMGKTVAGTEKHWHVFHVVAHKTS